MTSNKDMPAMPQAGFCTIDGNIFNSVDCGGEGLTKLEHFAGLAIPPMEMIIESLNQRDGVALIDDYIDYAVSYKIKEAKALLAQLDKVNDDE